MLVNGISWLDAYVRRMSLFTVLRIFYIVLEKIIPGLLTLSIVLLSLAEFFSLYFTISPPTPMYIPSKHFLHLFCILMLGWGSVFWVMWPFLYRALSVLPLKIHQLCKLMIYSPNAANHLITGQTMTFSQMSYNRWWTQFSFLFFKNYHLSYQGRNENRDTRFRLQTYLVLVSICHLKPDQFHC